MKLLLGIILFPTILFAQSADGIQFERKLSWEQLKAKAQAENKYLFIDCYATWCLPCKKMDIEVYPNSSVGKFYNKHFISAKFQMDTSNRDSREIINQYLDAHDILLKYEVRLYPTFLFFSPDGKLVHKAVGGFDTSQFNIVGQFALNSNNQYYTLLASYEAGERNPPKIKQLALATDQFGNKSFGLEIANEYFKLKSSFKINGKSDMDFLRRFKNKIPVIQKVANVYINKLTTSQIYSKENLQFIREFTRSSKDRGFKIFYKNINRINKVMGNGYAESLIDFIITKEEIQPYIEMADRSGKSSPDWKKIEMTISKKFDTTYIARNVLGAKISWYGAKKSWGELTKNIVLYIESVGTNIGNWGLNHFAWTIFLYSTNMSELQMALDWSYKIITAEEAGDYTDTYANLLYKLKRNKEAIDWEEKALKLMPSDRTVQTNLEKMKKGVPTWHE